MWRISRGPPNGLLFQANTKCRPFGGARAGEDNWMCRACLYEPADQTSNIHQPTRFACIRLTGLMISLAFRSAACKARVAGRIIRNCTAAFAVLQR